MRTSQHGALCLAVLLGLLLTAMPSQAAYLSCDNELSKPDCSPSPSTLTTSDKPHIAASCQECTGGSDLNCSIEEKVTTSALSIETIAGTVVAGSFSQVGTCGIGIPLFGFSTTLAAGAYHIVLQVSGHPKTLLASFTVGGSSVFDGGPPLPVEAGPPIGDGGGTYADGGGQGPNDGSQVTGDGGAPGGEASDSGCNCSPAGAGPLELTALLFAAAAFTLLRVRRRDRAARRRG